MKTLLRCVSAHLILVSSLSAVPTDPGLYAVFSVSQDGQSHPFTCRLHYDKVPRTVANFVRLARGEQPWLDYTSGNIRFAQPFYDSLTFHRVITNFMIQAGSPNGLGNDGPGYILPDEFRPDLTHDAAGVLSMANSGPNSNGSQFFVTVSPTPHLNGVHTVFGQVVEGMDQVTTISNTPTDANDRPLTPVVIESIQILAVGSAAQSWDHAAIILPKLYDAHPRLRLSEGAFLIAADMADTDILQFFGSGDLRNWTHAGAFGPYVNPPAPQTIDITSVIPAGAPRFFFRVPRVAYGSLSRTRALLGNWALRFHILNIGGSPSDLTIAIQVAPSGTGGAWNLFEGSASTPSNSGNLWTSNPYGMPNGYHWYARSLYSGDLLMLYDSLYPMEHVLAFTSPTNGTFTGVLYSSPQQPISGEFSTTPPP
ncbi:MAG TPA: peptidylprolyl isomerase [Verrucomicrobiae bacterium]|nr:peptidylprolyl isomerase [Verrucomicrobiae bacterium]